MKISLKSKRPCSVFMVMYLALSNKLMGQSNGFFTRELYSTANYLSKCSLENQLRYWVNCKLGIAIVEKNLIKPR